MKGESGYILKVAGIYVATIIGAGFASGREIIQFFSMYYRGGFFGIILAGLLFSIVGCVVLDKVFRDRVQSYEEFLFPAVGRSLGYLMEIAVTLFMFSVFSIMIAGSAKILESFLSIRFNYCIVIMSLICMLVLFFGIRGIVALSSVVTPLLIAGIIFIGVYIIVLRDVSVFSMPVYFNRITHNWFFSALLYVSYNSISSVVVMCSLLPYLKTRRVAIAGGILGGIMLCAAALIINFVTTIFYPEILAKEIPMIDIIGKSNRVLSVFYSFILWLAMLMSASTNGYGFMERVSSKCRFKRKLTAAVLCALVIPLASIGFSGLIERIYPVFGYVGLFMVFVILFMGIKEKGYSSTYK